MPVDPSARKPSEDWLGIVRKNGMPEFAAAFAANPVLHTSVMSAPCVGVECIAAFFAAAAGGMYDTLAFAHETVDGPKTYLEWEGKGFGKSVGDTTILTRNEAGLIQSIQIYHWPLALERNLFLRLCTSEPALARMRSYEGMKITAPSRSIEVETGSASHD